MKTKLLSYWPYKLLIFLPIFIITFISTKVSASDSSCVIHHPSKQSPTDMRHDYPIALLKHLIDITNNKYGDCVLKAMGGLSQKRQIAWLVDGEPLDIAWLPVTDTLNRNLLAIPVPIRKGFLGWRLLLIHRDNINAFSSITTLQALNQFHAGFGASWGDLPVMKHNFETVVEGVSYDALFQMLGRKRFDFYSRAVYEAYDEVKSRHAHQPELIIQPSLALHYRQADFFYLKQGDSQLHKRLTEAFEMAIQDGSFDKLFYQYYADYIRKTNMSQRTVIELENPYLPSNVPVDDPALWFQLNSASAYSSDNRGRDE